jgi:y4mF family transcriptional regulator
MEQKPTTLSDFLKTKRKQLDLTQQQLAEKAGVGLRFIRDLEQGKTTLRMDKVNQVLKLFGQELGPKPVKRENLYRDEKS